MAAMFFRIVAEDHFTLCGRVPQQSRVAPCGRRSFPVGHIARWFHDIS
jgi:hypothetical protein